MVLVAVRRLSCCLFPIEKTLKRCAKRLKVNIEIEGVRVLRGYVVVEMICVLQVVVAEDVCVRSIRLCVRDSHQSQQSPTF